MTLGEKPSNYLQMASDAVSRLYVKVKRSSPRVLLHGRTNIYVDERLRMEAVELSADAAWYVVHGISKAQG